MFDLVCIFVVFCAPNTANNNNKTAPFFVSKKKKKQNSKTIQSASLQLTASIFTEERAYVCTNTYCMVARATFGYCKRVTFWWLFSLLPHALNFFLLVESYLSASVCPSFAHSASHLIFFASLLSFRSVYRVMVGAPLWCQCGVRARPTVKAKRRLACWKFMSVNLSVMVQKFMRDVF